MAIGGTDISTGLAFHGALSAPAGSSVINPLTTLVTAIVEAGRAPADSGALTEAVAAATRQVVVGLGLPDVTLTLFDPLSAGAAPATALAVQKAAASVANLIATLEPAFTAVIAFFLLGESLSGLQLAGGAMILGGVVFLRVYESRINS